MRKYPHIKCCRVVEGKGKSALYDFKSKRIFKINHVAGDILDLCDGEKNFLDIENIVSKRYENVCRDEIIQCILGLHEKRVVKLLPKKKKITKKTIPDGGIKNYDRFLKMLHCEITGRCNLKCIHCYGRFGNSSIEGDDLSTTEWKKIISDAKKLKTETLQFIGGEPLLRKDFLELFHHSYSLSFDKIDIFTNGTLVSESIAKELSRKNVDIRFSVYGHIPEIHDEITQVKGSFKLLIAGIKKLKKRNAYLKAEAILSVKNINYKEKISNFFRKELDIPVYFGITRPINVKDFDLVPGVMSQHYCEFPSSLKKFNEGEICIDLANFTIRKKWNECFAGRLCINSNGNVIPCIFARELLIGNIRNKTLVDLYREDAKFIRVNYKIDNVDECKDCELRYACRDCRPWAYSITGNWYAKNPYCHHKLKEEKNED